MNNIKTTQKLILTSSFWLSEEHVPLSLTKGKGCWELNFTGTYFIATAEMNVSSLSTPSDFIPNLLIQKTDLVPSKTSFLCFLLQGTAPLADKPISALTFSMTGIATGSCARPGSDATKKLGSNTTSFTSKSADQMASTTLYDPSYPSNHCPAFMDFSTSTFPPCSRKESLSDIIKQ